jgi:uncharacterized RDD family membrane protein YckC
LLRCSGDRDACGICEIYSGGLSFDAKKLMNQPNDVSIFDDEQAELNQFEYASTAQRFANHLIDSVVFYLIVAVIAFFFTIILIAVGVPSQKVLETMANRLLMTIASYLVALVYYTLSEGLIRGKTIGKLLTKTVAVNEDLTPISFSTAFKRSLVRFIPFEGLAMFSGRPLHDSMTKTHVLKKPLHIGH